MRFPFCQPVGVLGGGQLGQMLKLAAIPLGLNLHCMDSKSDAPCAGFHPSEFTLGSYKDFQTVVDFGHRFPILTIEVEHVCVSALYALEAEDRIAIRPGPQVLEVVQDKALQKQFYASRGYPTAPFIVPEEDPFKPLPQHLPFDWPVIVKSRRSGYDGKGVGLATNPAEAEVFRAQVPKGGILIEQKLDIHQEVAILLARDPKGEIVFFPPVEMVFHPTRFVVEYLFAPANIPPTLWHQLCELAASLATDLNLVGILAVEIIITHDGKFWINEIAPRVHNSGHYTQNGCTVSQFEQHLRAITGLPLVMPHSTGPTAMINLLGSEAATGIPFIPNINQILREDATHLHWYGKKEVRPFRKMGHVNILASTSEELTRKVRHLIPLLRVESR